MHDLIDLQKLAPRIHLDIVYATERNFLGRPVYASPRCFLRKKTAERLKRIQDRLEKRGLGLKIWDGYRPQAVQKIFWSFLPDPRYVADPSIGSRHSRGAAVDLTLIDWEGNELLMPTAFDDFSEKAHWDFSDLSAEALENRGLLKEVMGSEGFLHFPTEWWHFDDPDWKAYPLLDIPFESL